MRFDDVHIEGMYGLGDNIYQRAFVRHMPGAYLTTPWPELYEDLDVKCVKGQTYLRTQTKNIEATSYEWFEPQKGARRLCWSYTPSDMRTGSILDALSNQSGVCPTTYDLPDFGSPPFDAHGKPVAIVRPVTVRREWMNSARNPLPQYIEQASAALMARGYHVISVADIVPSVEWNVGDLPPAHQRVHQGEWSVSKLLSAIQHARVVVGGVGWIVPAALCSKTPTYIVFGGNGAYNAPEKILPSSGIDHIGWAIPDSFCRCPDLLHDCEKDIYGFDGKFAQWLDGRGL